MSTLPPNVRHAVERARLILEQNPIYIDTETTGIDKTDGIIEVSVVDNEGQIIFESLVRPLKTIPVDATRVHHITNEMVKTAPNWAVVWARLRPILVGKLIMAYNADFDMRMLQQTHQQHGLPWREALKSDCVMKLYAEYRGEWDDRRGAYRYHSLDAAGKQCAIPLPNSHRASADTLLTRALLHFMAETQI